MKKNWFSGIVLMIAMLMCSVSFAASDPALMPVTGFDAVTVTSEQVDVLASTDALSRPNSDGIFDSGPGSGGIVAMASSPGDDGGTVPCMATCNHKATDNVTAYSGLPSEVGWR